MSLYKHKYQTKNGTVESTDWYYRFNFNKKTYSGSTGTSNKTAAQRFELAKKQELEDTKDTKALTIEKAFERYLGSQANAGELKNLKTRVSKMLGTMKDKRTQKTVDVFGFDGERPFQSLPDTDVQELVLQRRAAGNSNMPKVVSGECQHRSYAAIFRGAKADLQFASSSSLIWLSSARRNLTAASVPDAEFEFTKMHARHRTLNPAIGARRIDGRALKNSPAFHLDYSSSPASAEKPWSGRQLATQASTCADGMGRAMP